MLVSIDRGMIGRVMEVLVSRREDGRKSDGGISV